MSTPLNSALLLTSISTQLRDEGIPVSLSVRKGWINIRFTNPTTGKEINRSIGYRETASLTELGEIETLTRRLYKTVQEGGDYEALLPSVRRRRTQIQNPPSPEKPIVLVRDALLKFEEEYWQRVKRTSSTEGTYSELRSAFNHLEQRAALSFSLLKMTALNKSAPDSRSRKRHVEAYTRLGKRFNVENIESLKEIKGHYRPQARDLPTDEAIETFLDYLYEIKHIYRWHYAALATYGTRPGEVPSIVPNQPTESGDPRNYLGRALTIKRTHSLPTVRSIFAFPTRWYERYQLWEVIKSRNFYWTEPAEFDAARCHVFRNSFRRTVRAKALRGLVEELFPHFDCLQFRHRYAFRTIEANCNFDLSAQAMGHSAQVHLATYRAYVQTDELAAMMARQLGASADKQD